MSGCGCGCVPLFSHLHRITIFFKRIVLFCLSWVCFSCTQFEADRRAFIITINSFGTALNRDDRVKLYPTIGKLHPDGLVKLSKASDYEEVRQVADAYKVGAERLTHLHMYGRRGTYILGMTNLAVIHNFIFVNGPVPNIY